MEVKDWTPKYLPDYRGSLRGVQQLSAGQRLSRRKSAIEFRNKNSPVDSLVGESWTQEIKKQLPKHPFFGASMRGQGGGKVLCSIPYWAPASDKVVKEKSTGTPFWFAEDAIKIRGPRDYANKGSNSKIRGGGGKYSLRERRENKKSAGRIAGIRPGGNVLPF